MFLGAEGLALAVAALLAIIATLGVAAEHFAGSGFWSSLLPFALTVLGLGLFLAMVSWAWWRVRAWLGRWAPGLPGLVAVLIALGVGTQALKPEFARRFAAMRVLVGGVREAERTTIAHQVYAAYRRADLKQMHKTLIRAESFLPAIREAAAAHHIGEELLVGIAATESSFVPRDSQDGGRGLFQITAPPQRAVQRAMQHLNGVHLDLNDPRHNAHVAAATFKVYLQEMQDDLFLGLLAYNIGPRNGGLNSIMQQYGARDFATIQPYLQNLPRDYPIRVLSAALAYRLWRKLGALPRYDEGDNALRIQQLGIPGLEDTFTPLRFL